MSGVNTEGSTTTCQVVERADITPAQLRELLRQSLAAAGWDVLGATTLHRLAAEYAAEIGQVAAQFPVGTVLERRGNRYCVRSARAVMERRAERARCRRPRRKRGRRES